MKKTILLIVFGALVVAGLWLLGGQDINLQTLRDKLSTIGQLQQSRPIVVAALFLALYVAALSLPIAVWLTLAGGALFGFWMGLLIVSFASAIGATLAFLTSRYLLRD